MGDMRLEAESLEPVRIGSLFFAFCVRLFSLPDYEKAAELIFDIRYIRVSHDATEDMALLERFAYGSDP